MVLAEPTGKFVLLNLLLFYRLQRKIKKARLFVTFRPSEKITDEISASPVTSLIKIIL